MSTKRLLLDFVNGVEEYIHIDEDDKDGSFSIESRQNCDHIIEAAKILADEPPGKEFRHAAYIPQEVMDQAFREGWFNDKKAWKKWANSPDNSRFRTWRGRL